VNWARRGEGQRTTDDNWLGTGWACIGLTEGEVKVLEELRSTVTIGFGPQGPICRNYED
jgi:hypothetical protein